MSIRERIADALRVIANRIDGAYPYAVGKPALDADGEPMRRCTRCGVPRGTVRHALICLAGTCEDPDAGTATQAALRRAVDVGLARNEDVAWTGASRDFVLGFAQGAQAVKSTIRCELRGRS